MKMVVEMINPRIDERVLDSSCGTGGFLVMAMTHVIDQLEQQFSTSLGIKRENWDSDTVRVFRTEFLKWHLQTISALTSTPIW